MTDLHSVSAQSGEDTSRRRAIAASVIGTALEWFDFSVFAALATIIGAQFFAGDDPVDSFLSAVAVFGVGFLFRPLARTSSASGQFGQCGCF